jgi:hypothetical protein
MKRYGIDQIPIIYDVKLEQERPAIIEKKKWITFVVFSIDDMEKKISNHLSFI